MALTFGSGAGALELSSPAFENSKPIPSIYTGDGQNISPPLDWTGIPENASSLALICYDPDAPNGMWVHWVVYNIPSTTSGLKEGESIPKGAAMGKNTYGQLNYMGPKPPSGTHRYYFVLYALDIKFDVRSPTKDELETLMQSHILAQAELMGTYSKH